MTHVSELDLKTLDFYDLTDDTYLLRTKHTPGQRLGSCWIIDKTTKNIIKKLDGEVCHQGSFIRRVSREGDRLKIEVINASGELVSIHILNNVVDYYNVQSWIEVHTDDGNGGLYRYNPENNSIYQLSYDEQEVYQRAPLKQPQDATILN